MLWTLVASALLMGLAGTPHCLAMCGAPCAAAVGQARGRAGLAAQLGFHLARMASYAAGGAVLAAGVGGVGVLAQASPAFKPLWTLLHVAALALGIWLLWHGRQPAWVENLGSRQLATQSAGPAPAAGWQRMRGPLAAASAGSLWVAWPCALLQSALVVAALAEGPAGGAAVMAAFAAASSLGLVAGPALWLRLAGSRAAAGEGATWAVRLAGLALALAASWALGHGLWQRALDYCFG